MDRTDWRPVKKADVDEERAERCPPDTRPEPRPETGTSERRTGIDVKVTEKPS
jgi:hypothetical protein